MVLPVVVGTHDDAAAGLITLVIALAAGRMHLGEIRTAVDGISAKVLTGTLRDLERDGPVTRQVYAEVPPRGEYELTGLRRTLYAPCGHWGAGPRRTSTKCSRHAMPTTQTGPGQEGRRPAPPTRIVFHVEA